MAADEKQVSALFKRHEQIKRWQDSDTYSQPVLPKRSKTTVQFQEGCVFLAACSSGDTAEVEKLLRNVRSADINTANVDGLTALHQACIDDNLEMVEFLVEHGAYIDICDNEGWTPLHATASCGFLDIARYLINHNANVATVNNDGDLAYDIAENDDMAHLLQQEMNRKGIDAVAARCSEEQRMLEDANLWLSDKTVKEIQHPKTGATALHVAAAKGYIKVMNLLLEAGVNINAEDNDGWTPLHAAAYWGQKEACQILVNNLCDMGHKNKAGNTAFDLAKNGMMELLEELKEKQPPIQKEQEKTADIILPSGYRDKRSSSVTRMSADQKQNVLHHASGMEHITQPSVQPKKIEDNRTGDAETDHRIETIKPRLPQSQQPVTTAVSTAPTTVLSQLNRKDDTTTIVQLRRPASVTSTITDTETCRPLTTPKSSPSVELRRPVSIATSTPRVELRNLTNPDSSTAGFKLRRPHLSRIDGLSEEDGQSSIISTTTTATTTTATTPTLSTTINTSPAPSTKDLEKTTALSTRQLSIPRTDNVSDLNGTSVQSGALVSYITSLQERLAHGRQSSIDSAGISAATTRPSLTTLSTSTTSSTTKTATTDSDTKSSDRNTSAFGLSFSGYRSSFSGRSNNYVPYYMQRQQQRDAQALTSNSGNSEDTTAPSVPGQSLDRSSVSGITPPVTSSYTSTPTPASVSTTTTASTNSVFKRSYEPPKRDEETETQRKARAKHARQTRRSTQGVSLEDIEKAEESLHRDKNSSGLPTTSSQTLSSRNSAITNDTTSIGNGVAVSTTGIPTTSVVVTPHTVSTTGIPTASTTTTVSSIARASNHDHSEDKSISSGYRRWTSDDKSDSTETYNIRGSYRRTRIERDTTSSTSTPDVTTTYVPRSQRMAAALQTTDNVPLASTIPSLTLTSTPTQDESSTQEKKEEKKESTSLRARRQRRERRSTGIGLDGEGGETGGQNKPEDDDPDDNIGSVQDGRENSSSEHQSQRSKSASDVTKSFGHLEIDYKKKYDEEKTENERLKKELDVAKKGLDEAKTELDRANRQRDNARNSDRDKKILEKKLADMEEELKKVESLKADNQRLKDENGALIRVIGKLSK